MSDKSAPQSLLEAVNEGDREQVRSLVEQGADIDDTEGSSYGSPLSTAARKGHLEIVRLLLDAGAEIDFRNDDMGATPLMMAVDAGQVGVAAFLVDRGADVNATDFDGATAFMYARCAREDVRDQMIRLLSRGR
ncbi:MAG: ankyrin repeat domain-containing protein [Acidobacteria bacterium]|nr:ankyrin repeat domain-containing protein [Acidobacteriota bacterium]